MSFRKATVLLVMVIATTAYADDEAGPIEFCRDVSLIANQAMTARQQDRPMSQTLLVTIDRVQDWAAEYELDMSEEEAEEIASDMVMAAYKVSISPVDEYKKQTTTEFENGIFKDCYEETTSDSEE